MGIFDKIIRQFLFQGKTYAMVFDGVDDAITLGVANTPSWIHSLTDPYFRLEVDCIAPHQPIAGAFMVSTGAENIRSFGFFIQFNTDDTVRAYVVLENTRYYGSFVPFVPDVFHTFALELDKNAGKLYFYIDGVLKNTASVVEHTNNNLPGQRGLTHGTINTQFWKGTLFETRGYRTKTGNAEFRCRTDNVGYYITDSGIRFLNVGAGSPQVIEL